MGFEAGIYLDPDTKRKRWAVLDLQAHVWYFPKRRGYRAAEKLAAQLNSGG